MAVSVRVPPVTWLLLAVVLISGCASQPPWPADVPSSGRPVLVSDVPFYPQEQYQCGPASLAMMLNSRGIGTQPQALVDRVYLPDRQGTLQIEMVAAARQAGLLVYPLAPALSAVLKELQAGHPVLVFQNLRFNWWPQWHYAVMIGFDARQQELILHSGTRAHYRQPVAAFMTTWDRAERWAVTMLPPDELPATATPLPFLSSAHDLEATGQLEAAAKAYRTAYERWPDQPAARLGAGNVAYARQQWQEAMEHYQALTQDFPQLAAGWNNLGEALTQLDCPVAATAARQCATHLQPQRFPPPPAINTGTPNPHCPAIRCPEPAR